MYLQASFFKGGVILATAWHHQVADAHSLDTFLALFAEKTRAAMGRHTPCLGTAFELDIDRTPFTGVGMGESEGEGLPSQLSSLLHRDAPTKPWDEIVTMLVHIPAEQVAALKVAGAPLVPKDESDFVPTYDCVSTLLHRAVVRARLRTGRMQPNENTAAIHAVNMRKRAPEVHAAYFGNAIAMSFLTPVAASGLVGDDGLRHGALNARRGIRNVSLHQLRRFAHAHATLGADTVNSAIVTFMSTGITMTSWQQMRLDAYDLGFGPPSALRAPCIAFDGQIVFFPALPGQGIIASVTLRKECVQAMQQDEEFLRYAEVWDIESASG